MWSPFRGLSWRRLGLNVWNEIWEDRIFSRAAQLSYYFFLSLFPLLLLVTTVLGYMAEAGTLVRRMLLRAFAEMAPGSASELVRATLREITEGNDSLRLSLGALTTIWAASNGTKAVIDGLNAAYNVTEERPWHLKAWTALWLTAAMSVLVVTALLALLLGGRLGHFLASQAGVSDAFRIAWRLLHWPMIVVFLLVAFSLVYRFAPNVEFRSWGWVLPGAVVGVILWLVVSFGFRIYLMYFGSYSRVYGSLGAVIVLMLWFYLSGAAILIGGEVNSEIENAAAEAGDRDAKAFGEHVPGEKRRLRRS